MFSPYLLLLILIISISCQTRKVAEQEPSTKTPATTEFNLKTPRDTNMISVEDFSKLREDIKNAKPFDTIEIPAKHYLIKSPVPIDCDDLTIICSGCRISTESNHDVFISRNVNRLTLKGIHASSLNPTKGNLLRKYGGSHLSMLDCSTENLGLLFLAKTGDNQVHENLLINGCSVTDAGADGIKLQSVRNFRIENSKFIRCSQDGIKTNLAPCDQGIVRNCYFEKNKDDNFDIFGGGSNILIDSSIFVGGRIQIKNMGGQYYRREVENCTLKHNSFHNTLVLCLSKFVPNSEFRGLKGVVIDSNKWVNENRPCFQSNGAVNYRFTNNQLLVRDGHTAIDVRPPLGEGRISDNVIQSGITVLETNPKKGVYLLSTKKQSDPHFGVRDENSNLIITGNTFLNGRRDYVLDGLASYQILQNTSVGQTDRHMYLGVNKTLKESKNPQFSREMSGNVIKKEPK